MANDHGVNLPRSLDDIDDAWISAVLKNSEDIAGSEHIRILGTEPVGVGVTYASTLHRLRLSGPPGTPTSVIVKLPVEGGLRPMLDAIGAYRREVVFYREIAAQTPLSCARCYYAEQGPDTTDFAIVMEDLAALRPADQLVGISFAQAEALVDEMARAHAWSWCHPRLEALAEVFPPIDSPGGRPQQDQFAQHFAAIWPGWQDRAAGAIGANAKAIGDVFPELMDFFIERLSTPRTITLGDFRADNVFFDADGSPIIIDFQLTQQECGIREVAYLISQSLAVETRRGRDEVLVRRYHDGLRAAGVTDYPWDEAWTQYRIAVAYNLLYPVVASIGWEHGGERGRSLLIEMTRRASAAIDDVDALGALPIAESSWETRGVRAIDSVTSSNHAENESRRGAAVNTQIELIVVGAGAGGLVTAIRAYDLGLRPVIVEAAAKVGGATAFSGGQVWTGANHVMERIGVPDSLDEVRTYVRAIAPPPDMVDPAVFEQWVSQSPQVMLALEDAGAIEWTHVPHLCDYEYPGTAGSKPEGRYLACGPIDGASLGENRELLLSSPHHPPGPTWEELFAVWGDGDKVRELVEARTAQGILTFGTGLAAHFYRAALARGIPILTEHRAVELTLTGDAVTGVVCETPSGTVEFNGPVVLATGTYDWNDDFVREYSGLEPEQTGSVAPPSLLGDGIVLGRQAGANILRMPLQSSVHVSGYRALEPSGDDNGFRFCLQLSFPHSFMVDAAGRRFCDDSYYRSISHAILTENERSHLPYFLIWDEYHHKRYGLDPAGPGETYPAAMQVVSAPTVAELAVELGLDPDVLTATTARFNEHAAAGVDPDFHRGENSWAANFLGDPSHKPSTILGPVEDPPFYGMPMRLVGTAVGAAGVHAGTDGQALRPDGSPIPGLYAIGAAAAFTTSGTGYNSGMALSRAITFGYLVAEHVAAGRGRN